jgi:hypothetical protein
MADWRKTYPEEKWKAKRREWVLERPRRKAEEEGGGPLGRPGVLDF